MRTRFGGRSLHLHEAEQRLEALLAAEEPRREFPVAVQHHNRRIAPHEVFLADLPVNRAVHRRQANHSLPQGTPLIPSRAADERREQAAADDVWQLPTLAPTLIFFASIVIGCWKLIDTAPVQSRNKS